MIKTVELREQVRSLSWLKKWCFLVLLIGMGSVYLACVDGGEVLARPGAAVRGWLDGLASGNKGTGDGEKERCLPEGEENYLAGGSAAIALKRLSEARTEGAGNRLSGPGGKGSGMRTRRRKETEQIRATAFRARMPRRAARRMKGLPGKMSRGKAASPI